jgi:FAD/FMN-containing dehydrogenase
MAPFFANASCDPFTTPDTQCTLGTYVQYAVNASCVQDYQKTLDFAQEKNIRLVIRNTGHDYLGKSTGAGAIALWTHNIKDIEIVEYKSGNYEGPAMKTGAGVQGFEAQNAAHKQGLLVVTGNCPTVGIAGGYTQGGGHSPLSSKFGLAADQVLEWEVVTGEGKFMVASPSENPDLYWALSGGGGGTYAAVLSMTVKAYPDLPTAGGNLTFTTEGISQEAFYDAVQLFLTTLPNLVDAGVVPIWLVVPGLFLVQPIIAPGMTKDELQSLLEPTLARLKESGISHCKSP